MNKGIASETPEPLKWIQAPAPRRILPRVARLLACFPVSLLFAPTQTKRIQRTGTSLNRNWIENPPQQHAHVLGAMKWLLGDTGNYTT